MVISASIITPLHNSEKYISETVKSVLSQTYTNWEMIVVDDCSTDSGAEIVKRFAEKDNRIKLIQFKTNSGAAVARNAGIEQAQGRYIAFLDADDYWKPNKLEKQIAFMQMHNVDFSCTCYEVVDGEGCFVKSMHTPAKLDYATMLQNNYIGCLTVMYDIKRLGKLLMPNIRKRQDWCLWLRILKHTPHCLCMQEELAVYRKLDSSVSSNKFDLLSYTWCVYREIEGFSFFKSTYFFLRFFYFYIKKKFV